MKERTRRTIGLAIIGGGRVGRIRGELAAKHPSVGWIGIAELDADKGKRLGDDTGADFVTTDYEAAARRVHPRRDAAGGLPHQLPAGGYRHG